MGDKRKIGWIIVRVRQGRGAVLAKERREMLGMECVFGYRHRRLRRILAGAVLLSLALISTLLPRATAQPAYFLYYSLEVPLALPSLALSDSGVRTLYTGTLRGTLGGLPLTSATLQYGPGPTKVIGGGTFSLATAAGTVRDGHILMSTIGPRTTLLFFGMYLGTRLEFSLTSESQQIGGIGVTEIGVAQTGFHSHEEYRAAVDKAVASLAPDARAQVLDAADTNVRLVNGYQQKPQ
jgi:hypothetical protein